MGRTRGQLVALRRGGLRQFAQVFAGGGDHLAQHVGAAGGGLAELGRAATGAGDGFAQLRAQGFGLHRIGLVIGAQAVGGRDQGGALFGQALLDGAGLVDDAQARRFQPIDLAGEGVRGGFRRVAGLAGGGGQVGGAGGQRGLGLADLGFGQVGGLADHARLTGDGLGDGGGAGVQGGGQALHLLPLAGQALGQGAGGAAGSAGRLDQPLAFGGQGFAQGGELVLRLGGGFAGPLDFLPHRVYRRSGPAGGQGRGRQQALGQGARASGLGGQGAALLDQIGGDPDQHDGSQRQ